MDLDKAAKKVERKSFVIKEKERKKKEKAEAKKKAAEKQKKDAKKQKKRQQRKNNGCLHCIMPGKNFRCIFVACFVAGAGFAAYLGYFEAGDDPYSNEGAPEPVTPGVGSTVIAALFGYTVGPLMLVYGFKIKELIVVLNALIANGIDSFIGSLAYMHKLNADVSGGSLMPGQLGDLFAILMASFTLATASLKVRKLRAAIKGGVIANLVSGLITDQIPPQFGCTCRDEYGATLMCNTVVNWPLYELERTCYDDKWLRFAIEYSCIWVGAYLATLAQNVVDVVNSSVVAASLINEACFDTTLAVWPTYASRLQPYKMLAMGAFTVVGVYSQFILAEMALGLDPDTYCKPVFRWLSRIEIVVITPLLFLNSFAMALAKMGEESKKGGGGGKPAGPALPGGAVLGRLMEKFPGAPRMALLIYTVFFNPATARLILLVVNLLMMVLSLALVSMGVALLKVDSVATGFFNPDYVIVIVAAGCVVFILSLVGFGGGASGKFQYIIPYILMLGAVIVMEVAAFSLLYEKYDLGNRASAIKFMQDRTQQLYVDGNCTTFSPNPPPYNITCTEPRYRWYQEFTNTACEFRGQADVDAIKAKIGRAMAREQYDIIKLYAQELSVIDGTKARIDACLAAQAAGPLGRAAAVDDASGAGAWCVCSNILISKVDTLRNVAIVCTAVAGIQILMLMLALRVIGIDTVHLGIAIHQKALGKQSKKMVV